MRITSLKNWTRLAAAICLTQAAVFSMAEEVIAPVSTRPDMGKLLATGGISSVEGTAGGGITPWALIAGYGTRDSYGANAHYTRLSTGDFSLDTYGVALGVMDRFEVSLAKQDFRADSGPLDGLKITQDILGVKVRVLGDAVYEQDRCLPQIAIGAQYKRNNGLRGPVNAPVTALGAKKEDGVDFYVSATKLYLAQSLLLNGTLRATKANQMGILGFGGDRHDRYEPLLEASIGYLVNRHFVVGAEYRMKPRNLSADKERAYYDVFAAYFPTKNVSLTAAYANLGSIVAPVTSNSSDQKGLYLSLQIGF